MIMSKVKKNSITKIPWPHYHQMECEFLGLGIPKAQLTNNNSTVYNYTCSMENSLQYQFAVERVKS